MRRQKKKKKAARETSEAGERSSDVKEKHSRRWGEQRISQPRSQLNPGMLVFEYAEWFNQTERGLIVPCVPFFFFCMLLKVEKEKWVQRINIEPQTTRGSLIGKHKAPKVPTCSASEARNALNPITSEARSLELVFFYSPWGVQTPVTITAEQTQQTVD